MMNPQVKQAIDKALELKRSRQFSQALLAFEQIIEEYHPPQIDFCLSNMAHIQYLSAKYEHAQELAESCLQHNPRNWFALGILGEIALKKSLTGEALEYFEEANYLNPKEIYLITRLAKVFELKQDYDSAKTLARKALLEHPEESELYRCLGDIFKANHEIKEARENYLKAIQLNAQNQYAFRQWISTLETEKSKTEILNELKILMKLPSQQNNPFLRDYFSRLLSQLGQMNESTIQLETALKETPRSIYRKTRLASNYNRLKRHQEVIKLLEPEFKNGVIDQYLFHELVLAYLGLKQKSEARKVLILALRSFPNSRQLRSLLSRTK